MTELRVEQMTSARIPTDVGEFDLCHFGSSADEKEHLALIYGNIPKDQPVLVRMHSECFTGDVLGSRRCDCGPQLLQAMQTIAHAGAGIILYLRQEGRGIGLRDKLRAYNLQDEGYDTVEANLMLGHRADARDYSVAAHMLEALGVSSVRLLTNNPAKIESLNRLGIPVVERVPLETAVHADNAAYLQTKVTRMQHLLQLHTNGHTHENPLPLPELAVNGRPVVTLSYAQSLDGSITVQQGKPTAISGAASMRLTHQLRAAHDAILVGIGTVLADDPRLSVRLISGTQPRPIILDSHLRTPPNARLFDHAKRPFLFTTHHAPKKAQTMLEAAGAKVVRMAADKNDRVSLSEMLSALHAAGIQSLMVEGGGTVIGSFLAAQLADRAAITLAPRYLGGYHLINGRSTFPLPQITEPVYQQAGDDMVLFGRLEWPNQ